MRDIGKNIKTLRTQKNMTQDTLAERLFVTRQTVSNYETGKSRPDIEMLMKIAEVLDSDIHTVLYGPGVSPDRKRELIRMAVNGGILLVMALVLLLTREVLEEYYYNFIVSPLVLVRVVLLPAFFFLLGWTLVQGLSVALKAKRPVFRGAVAVRWCLLAVTAFLVLPVVIYTIPVVTADLLALPMEIKLPPAFARLVLYIVIALEKYPYILLFPGGGLWLCGLSGKKTE